MNMHIFSDIVKKLKKLNKYCRRFGTIKGINIVISIHFSKKKLIEMFKKSQSQQKPDGEMEHNDMESADKLCNVT